MSANNDQWLKAQCNRYTDEHCTSLVCLKRGGWSGGMFDSDVVATCEAHEILKELEELRRAVWNAKNNPPI